MAHVLILGSILLGGGSLLALGLFLAAGSWELVPLGLPTAGILALDAALGLVFFLQHSGMIRAGFRRRLAAVVPAAYQGALYSAASGAALLPLLLLWQRSEVVVWSLAGAERWLPRAGVAAGLLLFAWGVRSLRSFDALGVEAAAAAYRNEPARPALPFTVRGPYRLVRHPLYTAALLLFWAHPRVTLDRLSFALLWSAWIVVACRLEERDLVDRFGDAYRRYQRAVPMLIPWRRPRRDVGGSGA